MGSNEDHYSKASHRLSECRIQLKQSEKSALYLYKAECQHIDGRTQCYFEFMTFAIGDMKRTKSSVPKTEP